jgi:hypothetical protein
MSNFSSPGNLGSYILDNEDSYGGLTFLYSFINMIISVIFSKDIFIGSFLSKDVFPDINIFLDNFEDCLKDNINKLIAENPGVIIIIVIGLLLSIACFISSLCLLYQRKFIQPKLGITRPGTRKQGFLLLLLLTSMTGCMWTLQEARMVNKGNVMLPQVSSIFYLESC